MTRPNIILTMCDDLGFGDVGFNGNEVIRTPQLDAMAARAARFSRFYAGGPVCSPTRGTCLTGRHYFRYGVTHANKGSLPAQEINLAQVLRTQGYATGHFGKWHLGTLSKSVVEGNRGGPHGSRYYAPPWERGFDICFSTEAKVPTWDPMNTPAEGEDRWGRPGTPYGTHYWAESGARVTDNLSGDDSRVIMDRAIPFIQDAVRRNQPFFAVVWFHAPHTPVVAGPEYRAMYEDFSEGEQHYYGCITAMDEQVGRLNSVLAELGVRANTMHWFCSDNGPEGRDGVTGRNRGSTAGLRGRKRSLFNGGIAVPALLEWPDVAGAGQIIDLPCSTLDYFPTITDTVGCSLPDDRPLDGIDLTPIVREETRTRARPIPYRFLETREAMFGSPTIAMIDDRYKYLTNFSEQQGEDICFDLGDDPQERNNIIEEQRPFAAEMREQLRVFLDSCQASHQGADYAEPYRPLDAYQQVTGEWSVQVP
ncbi:MAG: sulfatase-like hydrolase/transferase [Chloroflexi bacterium]|nr:sulfatase-like hydrolase/transferase [Chloroflexota bacterium]